MTVKERLTEFIHYKGISVRSFCRIVGVSETYVSSMSKSVQPDKLHNIILHFPELNPGWLITGEGEMLRDTTEILPPIHKKDLVEVGSDIFKDKLIEMFKRGEIFSGDLLWEQHRMIIDMRTKIEAQQAEIEKLRIYIVKNGLNPYPDDSNTSK